MIETLTVPELARLCAEETARYLRREPYAERFCLELFRRAILQGDNAAWAAVYAQYTGLVRRWLGARSDADEDVAGAFERFWRAVDAAKFARFGSLAAVLQYLKMCAHTARLDRARTARSTAEEESLDDAARDLGTGDDVAEAVAGRIDAREFWRLVQSHLPDARERRVLYFSCVIGLSPREICARHGAGFPDVAEIYRLKRNALDRLRRAPKIKDFL